MREKLIGEIKKAVSEQYGADYEVRPYEIIAPGGCPIPSVAIRTPSESICPAIRIDHLLSPMECGLSEPEDAAAEFMDLYNRINDISQYTRCIPHIDCSYVLDTVTYRLVNTQKGSPHLSHLPHRKLLDLSAVYTVPVDISRSRDSTSLWTTPSARSFPSALKSCRNPLSCIPSSKDSVWRRTLPARLQDRTQEPAATACGY